MIGVTGRVVIYLIVHLGPDLTPYGTQVGGIGRPAALLGRCKSVQAHILAVTAVSVVVIERIDQALACRNLTPYGLGPLGGVTIHRQSVLKELLAVQKHILRHLSQVQIQVTACR